MTTHTRKRGRPHDRSAAIVILNAAVQVAQDQGYLNLTHSNVAAASGLSKGRVSQYYPIDRLRAAVCERAVADKILDIIAQAVVARCPHVTDCPAELKQRALQWVAGRLV